ncbi:hypothetical protein [uncultured Microbulbifer sp.]|uniref:hypothetical protein n=1 Tax=uncultured Microbulbifer sp. TaxID=348147 RepID=UPI002602E09C|nr:hypothetical protein [uncultured Microbulbifer sp.]
MNERGEDLEPNIDFELETSSGKSGYLVKFNKVAREQYPAFCRSPDALRTANFRDLNASITRMGTLADRGHITVAVVEEEIGRPRYKWQSAPDTELNPRALIEPLLGPDSTEQIDYDEPLKLASLIEVCRSCNSMGESYSIPAGSARNPATTPTG